MKKYLIILGLSLFVLTGCGSQESDKLSELEEKVATLEAEKEASKEVEETVKECPSGFASSLDKTQCIEIPTNAHAANSETDVWLCDEGFKEVGNSCLSEAELPTQAQAIPETDTRPHQRVDPMVQIKQVGECEQLTDGDVEDFFSCEFSIIFSHPSEVYEVDFNESSVFYEYALRKTKESKAVSQVGDITNYAVFAGKAGDTDHGKMLFPIPDELKTPLTFRFAIKQAGEVVKYLVVK